MAKYVILVGPAYGHVNPTLAVAEELVRRGNEVVYYLTEEFHAAVKAIGATFRPYRSIVEERLKRGTPFAGQGGTEQPKDFNFQLRGMALGRVKECEYVLPQVLEQLRVEQADLILYDPFCFWGCFVARILQIPAILFNTTYVMTEHFLVDRPLSAHRSKQSEVPISSLFQTIQAEVNDLCATYGVAGISGRDIILPAEACTIVFLPRAFQPEGESFDESFFFVGPCLRSHEHTPTFSLDHVKDQPILYISLGTVWANRPDFFRMCFQAFGDQPWHVIMVHGKQIGEKELGPVPPNFQLAPYVPQLEVLQQTSVFVTHGGMNSTMESLYYGVPMVVVPQMVEQERTARRCDELGLGIALDPNTLSVEQLRAAVEQVHRTPSYRERVQAMQQTVRQAGGHQRAADIISDFAHRNQR